MSCSAYYCTLFELVSHVRAAHSGNNLAIVCGVRGCPRIFAKTNTWYKHIRSSHLEDYCKRGLTVSSLQENTEEPSYAGSEDEEEMDITMTADMSTTEWNDPMEELNITDTNPTEWRDPVEAHSPLGVTKETIVGKMLKLKDKHRLSSSAVDEVVELVQLVCDNMRAKSMSAIIRSGEINCMDLNSDFFNELPEVFESVNCPLAMLETAYKQRQYVIENLPYIVRILVTSSKLA